MKPYSENSCVFRFKSFLAVFLCALTFGAGTGYAAVDIDQIPLTIRSILPPNIILMHDDSGSMNWTVMPDDPQGADYDDESDGGDRDNALINAGINGVYYNPNIAYLPPYTSVAQPPVSNERYPNVKFDDAPYDGFDSSSKKYHIALYTVGTSRSDYEGPSAIDYNAPRFSHSFRIDAEASYEYGEPLGCLPDYSAPNADGTCDAAELETQPPYCQGGTFNESTQSCESIEFTVEPCGSERIPGTSGNVNTPGRKLTNNNKKCRNKNKSPKNETPYCQGYGNSYYNSKNDSFPGQCCSNGRNKATCEPFTETPSECGSTLFPFFSSGKVNDEDMVFKNGSCVPDVEVTYPVCDEDDGFEFALDSGPDGEDCRKLIDEAGRKYRSYFVYIDPTQGQRHYVGVANAVSGSSNRAGTCSDITNPKNTSRNERTNELFKGFPSGRCHNEDDDSGLLDDMGNPITVGQNVANWFSYYRKRELTAKSGIMNAFASLTPATRFGFGSINSGNGNGNAGNLPTDVTTSKPYFATVDQFGDGTGGTQRAAFWDWLAKVESSGGTPLRSALAAVGDYYSTAHPWKTGAKENAKEPNAELSCRQSYTILMTDGFWNGSSPNVGDVDDPSSIKRVDGPSGVCFEYPERSGGSKCSAHPDPKPYVSSASDTLADVAMQYWLTDLRPNVTNLVPTSAEDPAFWQHMTTFTVGQYSRESVLTGVTPKGTLAETVEDWALTGEAPSGFAWPSPSASKPETFSDLVHAGINGHGGFFSAGDPQALEAGLTEALNRVQERVGTGASLAANSTRLDSGTTTYQSLYFSGKWTGDLRAFKVDPDSGTISTVPIWRAADELPDKDSRKIVTCSTCGTSSTLQQVDFKFANLSADQKAALDDEEKLVNYLRGDSSKESPDGVYRQRDTALGDIISSQPVFVGAPNPAVFGSRTFKGSGKYASFASSLAGREPLLWLAANDGMVHAFKSSSGVEQFAYLPGSVILPHSYDLNLDGTNDIVPGIRDYSEIKYGSAAYPHQYYNDGELTIADVYDGSKWRTVLIGTTGRGVARSVYALDVTSPANIFLLWERSAEDGIANSNWIGQIYGKPVVAQTDDGVWSVLLGNGYNSLENKAAMLQFDVFTGGMKVHTTGGSTDDGLSQLAVYIGNNEKNISTLAWAGDMSGAVWEFDLACTSGCSATKRFQDPKARPITAGMVAGKNPDTGDVWLFFGTGKYLSDADLGNNGGNRWYGLIVAGSNNVDKDTEDGDLIERSIEKEIASTDTSLAARILEKAEPNDMVGKKGWYMPLPSSAERMVTPSQFQGRLLLGVSRIPGSTDPCNPSGTGWVMVVDPFTGGSPEEIFFDYDRDGDFDDDDKLAGAGSANDIIGGLGFESIPNNPIFVGNVMLTSFDNATTSSIGTAGSGGAPERMTWREIIED